MINKSISEPNFLKQEENMSLIVQIILCFNNRSFKLFLLVLVAFKKFELSCCLEGDALIISTKFHFFLIIGLLDVYFLFQSVYYFQIVYYFLVQGFHLVVFFLDRSHEFLDNIFGFSHVFDNQTCLAFSYELVNIFLDRLHVEERAL